MKFFNLLKKELKELITLNTVIEMLVVLAMLFIMGNVMSTVVNDIMKTTEINVCDLDKTDFTKNILDNLENTKINYVDVNSDDRTKVMAELEIDSLIIIPKGFSDKILVDKKQSDLEVINVMHNSSMMGSMDSTKIDDAVEKIQDAASKSLLSGNYEMNDETIATVKAPVLVKPVTVIGEKSANVSSGMLASVSAAQGMIVPIIIFILIIFTSQMIISSISTEKIDKTLETLLSAPVSRGAVIGSKMLSATIVALLNAVVYMFGFSGFL
ncbi:MAG: ABC transporter permease, partial [Oscillospiraceae bacterium]